MPKFTVDVKAFISVEVEAPNAAAARTAANDFVDHLSPTAIETTDYAACQRLGNDPSTIIDASGGFSVDGVSEVEEIS